MAVEAKNPLSGGLLRGEENMLTLLHDIITHPEAAPWILAALTVAGVCGVAKAWLVCRCRRCKGGRDA